MIRLAAPFVLAGSFALGQPQPPIFKSGTASVSVSVSVKKGNNPVPRLAVADFRLFDDDVAQAITAVSIESVPVDVTLFLDTSGSTAGSLPRMADAVQKISAMLRPGDRFRVLTIGFSVYQAVPWRAGGETFQLDLRPLPGISLVYDALLA